MQNTCTIEDLWDLPGQTIQFDNILSSHISLRARFDALTQMTTDKLESIATAHQLLSDQVNIIKLPWQINILKAVTIEINNVAMAIAPVAMASFKYKSDGTITAVSNAVAKQCYYCRLIVRDCITLLALIKKTFGSFAEEKLISYCTLLQRINCVLADAF